MRQLLICNLLLFLIIPFNGQAFQSGPFADEVFHERINTVLFHKAGNPKTLPVIQLNSGEQVVLRFDVFGEEFRDLQYRVVHCDFNWEESDLIRSEYLRGSRSEYISDYRYAFNTHVDYTNYRVTFPGPNMRPTRSGNYALIIFRNNDPDDILLVRRFFIVEPSITFTAEAKPATYGSERFTHHEVEVNIHIGNDIPDPRRNVKIMMRQNGRWDNALINPEPRKFTGDRMVFDYGEGNSFIAGNEYRQFDTRSVQATGYNVKRFYLDSIQHALLYKDHNRSGRSYLKYTDYNGFRLINRRNSNEPHLESDYVKVHFSLDAKPEEGRRGIYLFGALTDWKISEQYRLEYNEEMEAFYGGFMFKQGYYNYLYVSPGRDSGKINSLKFEGSHIETSNDYSVYVYLKRPGDRTHSLVGYQMVQP